MKKNIYLLIITFFIFSAPIFSQSANFSISAQYRLRTELRKGYKTLSTDSSKLAFFTGQRARLIFDFKKDKISSKISVQDSRTWGDEEQKKDLAGLQVNELWFEVALRKGVSVKMGRQELVYDDHRLLGNLDWANLTISHDAILLKYTDTEKKINWHLGAAFNQTGEPLFGTSYNLKNYKALVFSWFKKDFPGGHSLSASAIMNGMNSTDIVSSKMKTSFTIGPLYNYFSKTTKAILGLYYQSGKTENNLSLNAFMVNAYAEKRFQKTIIGMGLEYLSGNSDNTPNNKSNNFNTLYATNHKFYGYMDYFINIPTDTKSRGLINPYLRLGYATSKTTNLQLDCHHFLLANEDYTRPTKISKNLGNELDLTIEYKASTIMNLQIGYSMMFATSNMEYLKGGNSSNYNGWAFIMLKLSPSFLNLNN
jgi:hypothetical protein